MTTELRYLGDVSLEQAAVWMDWSLIRTLALSEFWEHLSALWGYFHDVKTVDTNKYEHCTLKDWRPAEG